MPCKELTSLNAHLKQTFQSNDYVSLRRFLWFLFQILPVNINIKDAYRELLILETFLNVIQTYSMSLFYYFLVNLKTIFLVLNEASQDCSTVTQTAMDLLVSSTKGNVLNAQFITENLDIKIIKLILLSNFDHKYNVSSEIVQRLEEFQSATIILIKNLLFLAKNEQLFSSLLQLLFSDPSNITLCVIISKVFFC